MNIIPPNERLMLIGGDMNGNVGHERNQYGNIHVGNGFGTQNANGTRILEFAEASNIAILNTFFEVNITLKK